MMQFVILYSPLQVFLIKKYMPYIFFPSKVELLKLQLSKRVSIFTSELTLRVELLKLHRTNTVSNLPSQLTSKVELLKLQYQKMEQSKFSSILILKVQLSKLELLMLDLPK